MAVDPSPKSHWYCEMPPTGDQEADPSKRAVEPLMAVVKEAVGAWSGLMVQQEELFPTIRAGPAVWVVKSIGIQCVLLQQET